MPLVASSVRAQMPVLQVMAPVMAGWQCVVAVVAVTVSGLPSDGAGWAASATASAQPLGASSVRRGFGDGEHSAPMPTADCGCGHDAGAAVRDGIGAALGDPWTRGTRTSAHINSSPTPGRPGEWAECPSTGHVVVHP